MGLESYLKGDQFWFNALLQINDFLNASLETGL